MIEDTIERWHEVVRGNGELLDELLDDEVVFFSPVVFTPQRGKDVTKLYLGAASQTLGGGSAKGGEAGSGSGGKFRYTKQVMAGDTAVLEFETEMDGKYVNGVDIIRCNEAGRIVEFRVMIRPLQAIQAVHAAMARMLERMQGAAAG